MAVYTHLSQQELAEAAARYGFLQLTRADGIASGVENSNFLIEGTHEGECKRAILTVFEKRISHEELPFFMTLMQHLAAQQVPCPSPFLTPQGEAITMLRGKPASMVSFLQGACVLTPSDTHCRALGEAMAHLHLAGQNAPLRRANDLSISGWQTLLARNESRLDSIETGLRTLCAAALTELSKQWPKALPRGIIHADLFPDNVFFDASGALSGIIDLYFACEDLLAYDIAICLNCWCFDGAVLNASKAAALLEGYASVRPLEAAEREALPLLARGAALRFLLTRAHDWLHHDEAAIVTPHDPLEYARKLEWWQQQEGTL